jgi:hypothetical protein
VTCTKTVSPVLDEKVVDTFLSLKDDGPLSVKRKTHVEEWC